MARQLLVRLAFMPTRDRQDCQTQEEHVRNVLASFPPAFSLSSADSLSCAAQRWSKGCGGELTQIGSTWSWLPASRTSLAACTAGGLVGTGFCIARAGNLRRLSSCNKHIVRNQSQNFVNTRPKSDHSCLKPFESVVGDSSISRAHHIFRPQIFHGASLYIRCAAAQFEQETSRNRIRGVATDHSCLKRTRIGGSISLAVSDRPLRGPLC